MGESSLSQLLYSHEYGKTLFSGIFLACLLGQPFNVHAAPSNSSQLCYVTTDQTLSCASENSDLSLSLSVDVLTGQTWQKGFAKAYTRGPGAFSILANPTCPEIELVTSPAPNGALLTVTGHCSTPAQICMNLQLNGNNSVLRPRIAYVTDPTGALGLQSDERASTTINPILKSIRLCTDPSLSTNPAWNMNLFTGTPDQVQTAFMKLPADIKGPGGETVGLTKLSPAVKEGYIFVDLTENNADILLPLIKRSGFPYVLIYSSTWASSIGSYGFNEKNYPNGLSGLQKVVRAANAMGIKVGLHTLTSFVGKNDPLVPQVAGSGLLQDDRSTLLTDIDATTSQIVATDNLSGFPTAQAYYGNEKAGQDILIDDEIISCPSIEKSSHGVLSACKRGLYGTRANAHRSGTVIHHLAERYGSYLVDLHTPLKTRIAKRLGQIINDAGIDMVYFDGGEVGYANGEPAWFVAEQQIEILKESLNKTNSPSSFMY